MPDRDKLYTLTEVSKRTKISLPTLQRYKKKYQSRIPSRGKGRTQKYPREALKVFQEIKEENLKKRGRPKKKVAAKPRKKKPARKVRARKKKTARKKKSTRRKAAVGARKAKKKVARKKGARRRVAKKARRAAGGDTLLTLTEIGRRTGISYPTLVRYVKLYASRIPHRGSGRKRRFPEEAVRVFQEIRASSKRGRRKKSPAVRGRAAATDRGLAARLRKLESEQRKVARRLEAILGQLKKPIKIDVSRG